MKERKKETNEKKKKKRSVNRAGKTHTISNQIVKLDGLIMF